MPLSLSEWKRNITGWRLHAPSMSCRKKFVYSSFSYLPPTCQCSQALLGNLPSPLSKVTAVGRRAKQIGRNITSDSLLEMFRSNTQKRSGHDQGRPFVKSQTLSQCEFHADHNQSGCMGPAWWNLQGTHALPAGNSGWPLGQLTNQSVAIIAITSPLPHHHHIITTLTIQWLSDDYQWLFSDWPNIIQILTKEDQRRRCGNQMSIKKYLQIVFKVWIANHCKTIKPS